MSFSTWFTFMMAAWVIAISPGSGAVLSMSHGLNYGVKRASMTIAGLQAGLLLILAIAGAGVGSLLIASALAFNIVKVVGACYLIYLGWSQWRSDSVPAINPENGQASHIPSVRRRFATGFLTNATNPKGIIFMVAVLPQFITQTEPLLPQLLILALTMCTVDLIVMHSYAAAASALQRVLRDPVWQRRQNHVFGGLLMLIGAALLFVRRTPATAAVS